MTGYFWLTSYPKSGNTWLRAFLSNYLWRADQPIHINNLLNSPILSARFLLDMYTGFELSDLTEAEVTPLMPIIYREHAKNLQNRLYCKVHDALLYVGANAEPLFPPEVSEGAIYILRNPLDVAVSLSHFFKISLERSIRKLDEDYVLYEPNTNINLQVEYRIQTWRHHVLSWVDQDRIPVCLIRYEDMLNDPVPTFRKIVEFSGLDLDEDLLQRAIANSSFDVLQQQESKDGFQERPYRSTQFFRKGKSGTWRDEMTPEQAQAMIAANYDVMKRFGYLDDNDQPIY